MSVSFESAQRHYDAMEHLNYYMDDSENEKWWCEECHVYVLPEHVTYEETHDPRFGGCGCDVVQHNQNNNEHIKTNKNTTKTIPGFQTNSMERNKKRY